MHVIAAIVVIFFLLWFIHGLIEHLRDRRFNRATRRPNFENWRQVPPPNWRSARSGRDYW